MKTKLLKKLRRRAISYVRRRYKCYIMPDGNYRVQWKYSEPSRIPGGLDYIGTRGTEFETVPQVDEFMRLKVQSRMREYIRRKKKPLIVEWKGNKSLIN